MAPQEFRLAEALASILQDRAIRRHLALHDPAVLDRARRALATCDGRTAVPA
jgi:hypothetical protein